MKAYASLVPLLFVAAIGLVLAMGVARLGCLAARSARLFRSGGS